MTPIIYTSEMSSGKFPIDQYNLPWPLPSKTDDSHCWRHPQLSYEERMKRITRFTLDWAHEDWMQVLSD